MMQQLLPISVDLEGTVLTDPRGIDHIMSIFSRISHLSNAYIEMNFEKLEWVDGNLSAFITALEHRFKQDNGIVFYADFEYVASKFNVLFCNGWFKNLKIPFRDDRTTLPCTHFLPSEKDEFISYIDDVFSHEGMPTLEKRVIKRVKSGLIEIFTNVNRHAQTLSPLFICGQYYPRTEQMALTIVDIGIGFLPPISSYTAGTINSDIDAIKWAIEGNSTRVTEHDEVGGTGLSGLFDYFKRSGGYFQIYSGTDFWCSDLEAKAGNGHVRMSNRFKGSLINLCFNCQKTVLTS